MSVEDTVRIGGRERLSGRVGMEGGVRVGDRVRVWEGRYEKGWRVELKQRSG